MKTTIKYNRDVIGRFDVTGSKRDCAGISRFQLFMFKAIRLAKRVIIVLALFCGLGWSYYAGSMFAPVKTQAMPVPVYVTATTTAPVLVRIAKCESGNNHYDKNGQVLMKTNDNKSVDVGVMQINSIWFKKASEMKLDLTKEVDNRKFAEYLYENYGTEPWVWSKPCWNK
jgi:hypothetical protein